MSKPIDLSNVHPMFRGMIQAIAPDGTEFKIPEEIEQDADAQIDAALAKLDETIERLSDLTARLSTPNYEERD